MMFMAWYKFAYHKHNTKLKGDKMVHHVTTLSVLTHDLTEKKILRQYH
jgi:hypothetical protein